MVTANMLPFAVCHYHINLQLAKSGFQGFRGAVPAATSRQYHQGWAVRLKGAWPSSDDRVVWNRRICEAGKGRKGRKAVSGWKRSCGVLKYTQGLLFLHQRYRPVVPVSGLPQPLRIIGGDKGLGLPVLHSDEMLMAYHSVDTARYSTLLPNS
ncbi:hypothetical protein AOQ84DRAFT_366891 [Glonium stellatum]|uniref:Uncharacterized protein n=1 Tax=Glonium stellatum TaxID=574774 RepID=A0A8E2EUL0_9PEZI|nr:hypothetical protein AOQ84DRAFT_366891 [Glonium stellatum]